MGVHTGEGTLGGDDYVGIDVHRAARIADAAHGGQVIVSDATRGLVEHTLPAGASLRDLGPHHLRGLADPERLHQLVVEGLESDFPPPRTPSPVWTPMRTRTAGPGDQSWAARPRWAATTARTVAAGLGNTTKKASPWVLTSTPPPSDTARRTIAACSSWTAA